MLQKYVIVTELSELKSIKFLFFLQRINERVLPINWIPSNPSRFCSSCCYFGKQNVLKRYDDVFRRSAGHNERDSFTEKPRFVSLAFKWFQLKCLGKTIVFSPYIFRGKQWCHLVILINVDDFSLVFLQNNSNQLKSSKNLSQESQELYFQPQFPSISMNKI